MQKFRNFVLGVWKKLVSCETNMEGGKSSLAVFCRMDIGIRLVHGKGPQHFMNEVERTVMTSMWLLSNADNTISTLVDMFAMVFRQWVWDIRNPYIK